MGKVLVDSCIFIDIFRGNKQLYQDLLKLEISISSMKIKWTGELLIVSLPGEDATDSEIELASAVDNSDDFLSEEEINYYMNLEEK
jgi:hypothetical protein